MAIRGELIIKEEVFKKYVPPAEDIQAILNVASQFESDIIRIIFLKVEIN